MTRRKAIRLAKARWGLVAISANDAIAAKEPPKQFFLEPPRQDVEFYSYLDNEVLVVGEMMSEG